MNNEEPVFSGYDLAYHIFTEAPEDPVSAYIELAGDEVSWLEFKAGMYARKKDKKPGEEEDDNFWHISKAIMAMLNSSGGVVIIGVEDKTFKSVDLAENDPNHVLANQGQDAFFRLVVENNLPPERKKWNTGCRESWSSVDFIPSGHICFEKATYDGNLVVLVFVKPLDECQTVLHGNKEVMLVKRPGARGRVDELKSHAKIRDWEKHRTISDKKFNALYKLFCRSKPDSLPFGLYGRIPKDQLFVGRNDEIAAIQSALIKHALVVIHGGGGKGKTTLAEHVATDWLEDNVGHAFWIDAEQFHNWESIMGQLVGIDPAITGWLDPTEKEKKTVRNSEEDGTIDLRKLLRLLIDKCNKRRRILLILDNVEESNLFSENQFKDWFGEGLPNGFNVLVTSRIGMARPQGFNPVHQIELGYLNAPAARTMLGIYARGANWNETTLSDDERKALDNLVTLTRGHAWTIRTIGKFIESQHNCDDCMSKPMSFRSAFETYREQGIAEFTPDDPLVWKKTLSPTLSRIQRLPSGDTLFNLARFAALLAHDGVVEKLHLRDFWRQTVGAENDAFERAVNILVRESLFDSRSDNCVVMHRNTQDVLLGENDAAFYSMAGSFLADYPGLDLRRWPYLLEIGVPSKYCPVRLMDNALLRNILPLDWSFLDANLIEDFSGADICWALLNGPENIRDLPWRWNRLEETGSDHIRFSTFFPNPLSKNNTACFPCSPRGDYSPAYWTEVLLKIPSLIHRCDFSNLSHDDIWVLTKAIPKIVDDNPFFRNNPRGIVHYLMSYPDAATDRKLSLLDPEDWQFLVHERNQFEGRMPLFVRSLLERVKIARERGYGNEDYDYDNEYELEWYKEPEWTPEEQEEERIYEQFGTRVPSKEDFLSSEIGREIAVYLMLHPEDSFLRSLEPLESGDWLILFAERPELIDEYGTEKVIGASSEAWVEALSDNSDLVDKCHSEFELSGGWDMFSGEDWANLLVSNPPFRQELVSQYNLVAVVRLAIQKLSGKDWAKLLNHRPSFAGDCPWKDLAATDYAELLVSHPEWANDYGLSFSGLNEEQWIALLRHHPELWNQCHVRFTEKVAFDLAALVKAQPVLLNALSISDSTSLFDPLILFVRGADGTLPWYDLICQKRHGTGSEIDCFDEWQRRGLPIRWDVLSGREWDELLSRHPECEPIFNEKKGWTSFTGADWAKTLSNHPEWFDRCDWAKLKGDDWVNLLARQRQLVRYIPEDVCVVVLMQISISVRSSFRLLKELPLAQSIFDSSRQLLDGNLRSKQTVLSLESDEIVWPHMDWVPFCCETKRLSIPSLLQSLVKGFGRSYRPHDPKLSLNLLSGLVFECQDMSEVDICILERRIAEEQIDHGFFDEALVVLDGILSFVETAKASDFDNDALNLSLAISDCFYHCCKGDIFWKKGQFQKAIDSFSAAISSPQVRFEEYVSHKLYGKPPYCFTRSVTAIKQDLFDCKLSIPIENSCRRWFHRLNLSFDPHPDNKKRTTGEVVIDDDLGLCF